MVQRYDVVVVGAGIAGSALARVLARNGLSVLLLERDVQYRDKVRGEYIAPWGVRELQRLDLESLLLDAGGARLVRVVPYDEVLPQLAAEERAVRIAQFAAPYGYLDVGHPQACEALSRAAEAAGADVLRGVESLQIERFGAACEISYVHGGAEQRAAARLIVGADGRQSAVRKRLGSTLHQTTPRTIGAGLLVRDFADQPADQASLGTSGDCHYLVFPRANGVARLYIMWNAAQRQRFAGPEGTRRFLDAWGNYCFPYAAQASRAEPIGPCASYAMNDSYVAEPAADGVVLIGDAAGWNDPIIGQGLSIALRDARMVSEILLDGRGEWSKAAFAPYVDERRERMRRLRISAQVATDIRCTFTPAGVQRRRVWFELAVRQPWSAATALCSTVGPEQVPAEGFEPRAIERILAMG